MKIFLEDRAKLRPNSWKMPSVTVIIPAYNEEKVIDDCLSALSTQSVGDFKVVVIDDASIDNTAAIVKSYAQKFPSRFELKQFGKVGPGRARNLVARDVETDFVAFTDADCIPTSNWIEELLKGFTNSHVGSVGGPHRAPSTSSPFQRNVEEFFTTASFMTDFFKRPTDEIIETPHNPLCNVMYRTQIFKDVKGFREDLFPGEDVEIDFKVAERGYAILYNPRALVFHHRPESIQQFRKVMHAYGRAQGKLVREYGLRRKIQWMGVGVLLALAWICFLLVAAGLFMGVVVAAALLYFFFGYRPILDSKYSIFCNSLQWFNGFIEGIRTGRSLPPGGC
jgi:GT2 family glycosyltransferase